MATNAASPKFLNGCHNRRRVTMSNYAFLSNGYGFSFWKLLPRSPSYSILDSLYPLCPWDFARCIPKMRSIVFIAFFGILCFSFGHGRWSWKPYSTQNMVKGLDFCRDTLRGPCEQESYGRRCSKARYASLFVVDSPDLQAQNPTNGLARVWIWLPMQDVTANTLTASFLVMRKLCNLEEPGIFYCRDKWACDLWSTGFFYNGLFSNGCVPFSWAMDGIKDCEDGSDEGTRIHHSPPHLAAWCPCSNGHDDPP